ncbi:hypothetical protein N7466_009598 [Penicillium verhagenii]|uniref:uncharacterized protein n=1 Tax=Penicillium verhagenii TaxID=1562060 RepID=UPI00254587A3|nr:uncharacterized protein N7466_009598 [Penicillium verhagenii]KAJ5921272.1 hypothetical protein N7466_009598 [Penicillium verhagenii]
MERKLSQKAAQMRQRLFTRHNHSRGRAATMITDAPRPVSSASSTRSRSATTPIPAHPARPDSDSTDTEPTRFYHFTDVPGYFRPATPYIDRQDIDEDLVDNVKHACSLLVESIERGLPIWPSFHTVEKPLQKDGSFKALPQEQRPIYQGVMAQLSLSPVEVNHHLPFYTETWDGTTPDSPPTPPNAYQTSSCAMSPSAGTGRFYGTQSNRRSSRTHADDDVFQIKWIRPASYQEKNPHLTRGRGRGRGHSSATYETTSAHSRSYSRPRSRSRSRSRSSSPGFFPYSPPQFEGTCRWDRDTAQIVESPDDRNEASYFPAPGDHWDREAVEIMRSFNEGWEPSGTRIALHVPKTSAPNTAVPLTAGGAPVPVPGPGPAQRRFYSASGRPTTCAVVRRPEDSKTRDWDAFEVQGKRDSALYRSLSMSNVSSEEEKGPRGFSYPVCADQNGNSLDSKSFRRGEMPFYDVGAQIENEGPGRHRRKRASELLKKLTGLGMRRKETGGLAVD